MENDPRVRLAISEYQNILPPQKDANILDIGFGNGWFLAACLKLSYTRISGADFGASNKEHIKEWGNGVTLHEIEQDIGEFLVNRPDSCDFIHMSHVIEHIPKHSLLWVVDAIFSALKRNGKLLLRTPNMEGPTANSSLFVTLAHEYGFSGGNLTSLLDICGFDDIELLELPRRNLTLKQRIGKLVRWPYLAENRFRHRLFGVNEGGQFDTELVAIARRGNAEPLFDPKYR
jgi:SAM-dependent methyltransferase